MATLDEKRQQYQALAHAMQSGVAYTLEQGSSSASPKHLRTGVNVALVDHAALVKLLLSKGVFTEDEYLDAMIDMMQREVDRYEQELSQNGLRITLR